MAKTKQHQRLRQILRLSVLLPASIIFLATGLAVFFTLTKPKDAIANANNEVITTGSFIIDMGKTPQTYNNGLRPYGMIYDLIINHKVPIKWVINPTKAKDGTDFSIGATLYKGGPFIVPKEYISSAVSARITYWQTQGVIGNFTSTDITVPVYATITNFPTLIIDDVSGKQGVITNYFSNAMIPSTGYAIGTPSALTYCHDMWVNPHGDPTWATHGYLYDLVTVARSNIWMQCHAVSVTEGVKSTSGPVKKLSFLSTNGLKCYSGGKCGADINETHAGGPTGPFVESFPTDPVMQFMGTMSGATDGGSEKWYEPVSSGSWLSTTKRLVTTANGSANKEGVLMAYGHAYGDINNGLVMYEGGHDLDGNGTTAEKTAAQRAFFNFVLLSGISKQIVFNTTEMPSILMGNEASTLRVSVSAGSPGYTYAWTSTVGGTFSNPSAATTNFTSPVVSSSTSGYITCTVTDACGRRNFVSRPFTASPAVLPVKLKSFSGKPLGNDNEINWTTASEINNDYFTVLHRRDGENFESLGTVDGGGNRTTDRTYSFIHRDPGSGNNYYQLKQTDFDGKSEVFNPIIVRNKKLRSSENAVSIGPNPFSERLSISYFSERDALAEILIYNQTGKLVRRVNTLSVQGKNSFDLENLQSLQAGIYYVSLQVEKECSTIKLLKQ